jgi:hypothetical protein
MSDLDSLELQRLLLSLIPATLPTAKTRLSSALVECASFGPCFLRHIQIALLLRPPHFDAYVQLAHELCISFSSFRDLLLQSLPEILDTDRNEILYWVHDLMVRGTIPAAAIAEAILLYLRIARIPHSKAIAWFEPELEQFDRRLSLPLIHSLSPVSRKFAFAARSKEVQNFEEQIDELASENWSGFLSKKANDIEIIECIGSFVESHCCRSPQFTGPRHASDRF